MTPEEYIASGILELYLAGALSEKEMEEVKRMADVHPRVMDELLKIEETFITYVESRVAKPDETVLENVMTRIKTDGEKERGKVFQLSSAKEKKSALSVWLVAASFVLLIGSNGLSFYFYSQWKNAESELALMQKSNSEMASEFLQAKNKLAMMDEEMKVMEKPGMIKVMMNETENGTGYSAMAVVDKNAGDIYLKIMKLPAAREGMQYQLWAMVGGKPVDAGVVTSIDGIHKMKTIPNAGAYAITLEPMGGSASPTMPIYVMGKS